MKKRLVVFFYMFLVIVSGPAHSRDDNNMLKRSFAWPLTVNNLDPHNTSSDTVFSLIAHYLSPLVNVTPANEIVPSLAESWIISKDQKTITLHLRKGIKWSDGTPLTALQVKQSFDRALSKEMKSDARSLLLALRGVKERIIHGKYDMPLGIETQGDHQISFHLTHSYAEFLRVLTFPFTSPVPMHLIAQDNQYPSIEKLVSSGAYKVVKATKHFIEYTGNEQYFSQPAYYQNVSFQFSDHKDLIKNFLNNSLDTVEYIALEQMPWLEKNLKDSLIRYSHQGAFYLIMSHYDSMKFPSELRSLMMGSLDFKRINQLMTRGYISTVAGLIPWQHSAEESNLPIVENNTNAILAQGRSYLESQGFSEKNPKKVCILVRKSSTHTQLFNLFKSYWKNMHIELSRKNYTVGKTVKYIDNINSEEVCPIIIRGYASRIKSEEDVIFSFFQQGGVYSKLIKHSPELTKHYKNTMKITDPNLRKKAIRDLEKLLLDNHYAEYLYKTDIVSLVNHKKINNFTQSKRNFFIPLSQDLKPKR